MERHADDHRSKKNRSGNAAPLQQPAKRQPAKEGGEKAQRTRKRLPLAEERGIRPAAEEHNGARQEHDQDEQTDRLNDR